MAISKDLVAASSVPFILSILRESDSYGYAIIQRVKQGSGQTIAWTDGMLYPVLHRLEERRFLRSYWEKGPTGRMRKYYSITESGLGELELQKRQWRVVNETLSKLWEKMSPSAQAEGVILCLS